MTKYFVYDVFTNSRFGGNPLAIIPDASELPEANFQRIAREFNFSETAFFFATRRSQPHRQNPNIFTTF